MTRTITLDVVWILSSHDEDFDDVSTKDYRASGEWCESCRGLRFGANRSGVELKISLSVDQPIAWAGNAYWLVLPQRIWKTWRNTAGPCIETPVRSHKNRMLSHLIGVRLDGIHRTCVRSLRRFHLDKLAICDACGGRFVNAHHNAPQFIAHTDLDNRFVYMTDCYIGPVVTARAVREVDWTAHANNSIMPVFILDRWPSSAAAPWDDPSRIDDSVSAASLEHRWCVPLDNYDFDDHHFPKQAHPSRAWLREVTRRAKCRDCGRVGSCADLPDGPCVIKKAEDIQYLEIMRVRGTDFWLMRKPFFDVLAATTRPMAVRAVTGPDGEPMHDFVCAAWAGRCVSRPLPPTFHPACATCGGTKKTPRRDVWYVEGTPDGGRWVAQDQYGRLVVSGGITQSLMNAANGVHRILRFDSAAVAPGRGVWDRIGME